ncbi:uncharacterized protein LOC144026706 isoform X2 [Festucalex cinctus]
MMQQQCVIVKAAEWKKYKAEVTCKRLLSGNMDARRGREEPTNAAFSLTSKVDCKMISSLFLRGEMEPALAQTWRAFNVVKGVIPDEMIGRLRFWLDSSQSRKAK